jgi:hypothetical protein
MVDRYPFSSNDRENQRSQSFYLTRKYDWEKDTKQMPDTYPKFKAAPALTFHFGLLKRLSTILSVSELPGD